MKIKNIQQYRSLYKTVIRDLPSRNENFIGNYLTGHDNINVFGQVEMKYFIKAGSSAIDIQLKK